MTRADAMRGSWWWIFDIIFSLKLMWDSQNDFIIIISGHVPVPLFSGPISALRNERIEPCRVLELSRGKSNHFPLSKIEVQAVRMILIIILILLITSYSSEKSQKHHFKTPVRLWKFMVSGYEISFSTTTETEIYDPLITDQRLVSGPS